MSTLIDETGAQYGELEVLGRAENTRYGSAQWKCECSCGNIIVVRGKKLRRGQTSCGCQKGGHNKLEAGVAARNVIIKNYRQAAERRGFEWSLEVEQFVELAQRDCYYCGSSPSNHYDDNKLNGSFTYNGLDRKNSNRGYTPDNVVPCCFTCNRMKGDMNDEQFGKHCAEVAKRLGVEQRSV